MSVNRMAALLIAVAALVACNQQGRDYDPEEWKKDLVVRSPYDDAVAACKKLGQQPVVAFTFGHPYVKGCQPQPVVIQVPVPAAPQ